TETKSRPRRSLGEIPVALPQGCRRQSFFETIALFDSRNMIHIRGCERSVRNGDVFTKSAPGKHRQIERCWKPDGLFYRRVIHGIAVGQTSTSAITLKDSCQNIP